jgi:hypothetical protein
MNLLGMPADRLMALHFLVLAIKLYEVKEPAPRPPPQIKAAPVTETGPYYDFTFIEPA